MYPRIMVAIDGSDTSKLALDEAIRIAKAGPSNVLAVLVFESEAEVVGYGGLVIPNSQVEELRATALSILGEAKETLDQNGVAGGGELIEKPSEKIDIATLLQQQAERWEANLVVLGTHGRRGLQRMVIGSVAESFVRQSNCPVLLVRGKG
ncbi:universal stress protein [Paraburkholderia phymatum]|uniref:UspA domain protein n=1 Tax=Paraburkholderia phymatum (strain DSM 17167 / CIP 108236 / LMG 21445 / STM815) TaxID=391038 RepID=B2JUA6_PARP8|nr:universal stress protein [Paraburkholderia phymatum]ACC74628.1 UspA domain protein [Paraburkholderia phymatum STM815]